jgi:ribosome-binding factor A
VLRAQNNVREIMNRKFRKKNTSLDRYRAEVHEDDGQDPRYFFRKETTPSKAGRKAMQLCAQVADTLSLLFSGETSDEIIQSLEVRDVAPAPNASQLLVTVAPAPGAPVLDAAQVNDALGRAGGWLRSEIAEAITRKRVPRLAFRFIPAAPTREVQS